MGRSGPAGRCGSGAARSRRPTTASSCPTTRWCSRSSMWMSFSRLALEQPVDRDARPAGDDGRDVVLVDLLLHHRVLVCGCRPRSASSLLERRELAVADLRHALEIALALGALGLHAQLVDPARLRPRPSRAPPSRAAHARGERVALLLRVGQRPLDGLAHLPVDSFAHRSELDLELHDARGSPRRAHRRRVDLHSQPRGRLVDEVDRLVRQEAVGDVAVREHCRRDERGVVDAHTVVGLVALLEPAQDRDRVLDASARDEDGLEAPLERGVLLDVLAVFVERGRADAAQLAARERGLSMFAASMAPSAAPAPTTVCISSMKRMIRPSAR